MKKQLDALQEFQEAFGSYIQYLPNVAIPFEARELRIKLMREELKEVEEAMGEADLAHIGKELADLLYVVLGTVHAYGLGNKFEAIFDEVHRSNMSKLDKDGKPIFREDGKVLKSDQFRPADIDAVLNQ
ncbi:MAG TPA: nucleoside triphosphate pyrophosphohydrolase family protein [Patescibacteria group bacterium]|nr:nucleoside triphosphate pyrophosphohydrolase family protein [Patescibacteria group bacterium]